MMIRSRHQLAVLVPSTLIPINVPLLVLVPSVLPSRRTGEPILVPTPMLKSLPQPVTRPRAAPSVVTCLQTPRAHCLSRSMFRRALEAIVLHMVLLALRMPNPFSPHRAVFLWPSRHLHLLLSATLLILPSLLQSESEESLQVAVTQVFREFGPVYVKIRRDAKHMPFAFCQYTVSCLLQLFQLEANATQESRRC